MKIKIKIYGAANFLPLLFQDMILINKKPVMIYIIECILNIENIVILTYFRWK